MLNYNILFKITGSIAVYKSAIIISKLVQAGCKVKVVATESALKFAGNATFEGLTGNKVLTDSFAEGEMMSHINLVKWADLVIVAPATANTINKLASGAGDSLLTSLFLAHDWTKPYLIAPAMNTNMFKHPATQEAMNKLASWGATILPTDIGYLACGDVGEGKLLDTDLIYEKIISSITSISKSGKNVLITYGGTSESLDGVRTITNISTGKTGAAIAEQLAACGHKVSVLRSKSSLVSKLKNDEVTYGTFDEYKKEIFKLLSEQDFDAVIHLAALSDYTPTKLEYDDQVSRLPLKSKLNSEIDTIKVVLKKNPKIISQLKSVSKNKEIKVIGFKLTNNRNEPENLKAVNKLFSEADCVYVVHNDLVSRTTTNEQTYFTVYDKLMNRKECTTVVELAKEMEIILENNL
ncbi:MAG: phosphopantothenoylcysteine decarboxylase / phosphopantothenate--cysteine ligase [Ignavibacteria bacterium]|nr:MAG: phosphopantothenoylcysteine decarboxylase / phosphopantothenate--cysteine ligase [Ignavibacteria bacterium]KAF0160886.1 MAG: phosphopantothenoylcysteine decarboxylase / phosphopantothenate--cysteine ligase [Ignavibacteria bacterium]